jgi:hypothetical protein
MLKVGLKTHLDKLINLKNSALRLILRQEPRGKTNQKERKSAMSATRVRGRIPRTPSFSPVAEKIN